MNYFEHHIGDYLRDTAHLSLLEHGVYRRLIDVYYTRESAIPQKEVARLIAARTKDEREALTAVLEEFFVIIDGAYTQKRCEEELHAYRESQEGAEDKKVNDKERQRRARERRKALFEELRCHNVVPPWDTKTADLQAMLSRVTNTVASAPVTQPVTRDNTATQTPVPSTQYPIPKETVPVGTGGAGAPPQPSELIFGLGVPLLTAANVAERNARSMLGLMRKTHGDSAVLEAIQRCAEEKPLEPVAWLQAALKQRALPSKRRGGSATDADLAELNAASNAEARRRLFGEEMEIIDA